MIHDRTGNRVSRTTEVKTESGTKTQTVKYGYDALGLAASVELPGHEPIKLTRNALGQVTEEQLSPNLKRTFDYSWEGYLTHQRVFNHEGSLFRQEYKYDRTGNLVQKVDSVFGMDQFNYDPIGRITGQTDPERKYKAYLYDPAGDLLKTQVQSEDEAWSRAGEYEGVGYRFDRVGNLVERTGVQDKTEFFWDANGRLVESVSDGKKTTYQYDPLGRRVSKETDGVVTRFYWDGDALLGDVTGDDTREWVYYPGSFEPLAMVRNEQFYLYHNDLNGCPSRLLDESGKVVWAARYDAWGKVKRLVENEVEQPLRLQGQYFDGETGLHYNRFRYYCAEIGAFVSQDPLGLAAGENVYGFGPNAQGWIDPLGLCKKVDKKANNFAARQTQMLKENKGYNISPESWFKEYNSIGRNGSFITDKKAIQDVIGEFKPGSYKLNAAKTTKLENALGLQKGSLFDGFRIIEVNGIRDMAPRSPLVGNQYFLGGGKGLPGGGPEMIIDSIPTGR